MEIDELVDVDLKSAYTTALALIQVPDWSTARQATDLADLAVVEDAMTFAYVKFAFPPKRAFRACLCERVKAAVWFIRSKGKAGARARRSSWRFIREPVSKR